MGRRHGGNGAGRRPSMRRNPGAFIGMLQGENVGKQLVRLA